jgi:hypothetical protein
MYVTLLVWLYLKTHNLWHPEEAVDDCYGMGLVFAGMGELALYLMILSHIFGVW